YETVPYSRGYPLPFPERNRFVHRDGDAGHSTGNWSEHREIVASNPFVRISPPADTDPMTDHAPKTDYATQSRYSDPGRYAALLDPLPTDIAELTAVVRNVIVHYRAAGLTFTGPRLAEVDHRWLDRLLDTDQRRF